MRMRNTEGNRQSVKTRMALNQRIKLLAILEESRFICYNHMMYEYG